MRQPTNGYLEEIPCEAIEMTDWTPFVTIMFLCFCIGYILGVMTKKKYIKMKNGRHKI